MRRGRVRVGGTTKRACFMGLPDVVGGTTLVWLEDRAH